MHGRVPARTCSRYGAGLLVISLAFHLLLRWRASYADPLLLPIVTLLNGLGLVMIHRLDIAHGRSRQRRAWRCKQLIWSALARRRSPRSCSWSCATTGCCGATPSPRRSSASGC